LIHLLAELRLTGGVLKQQPEPGWILAGGLEQRVEGGLGERTRLLADRRG
jgi:hypothetical protein